MFVFSKKYIVNPDNSVTFLQDYSYEYGGRAKKGETISMLDIRRRDIRFCHKTNMKTWGYNCENKDF